MPAVVIDEWLAPNASLLRTIHFGNGGMVTASVLLVGLEAVIDFSRHTAIIRGDSLYENGGEYERGGVVDVTEQALNINNTMSITYLRALCDGYRYSRT
jgi:hypothetical protein